jgi:hypothetical protein
VCDLFFKESRRRCQDQSVRLERSALVRMARSARLSRSARPVRGASAVPLVKSWRSPLRAIRTSRSRTPPTGSLMLSPERSRQGVYSRTSKEHVDAPRSPGASWKVREHLLLTVAPDASAGCRPGTRFPLSLVPGQPDPATSSPLSSRPEELLSAETPPVRCVSDPPGRAARARGV